VNDAINTGDHGSTFAASPLICTVAENVLSRIANPEFLAHVAGGCCAWQQSTRT
jgi:acetylornithine/succinyldiaminopimelate/putrescine aminotransferase